MKLVRRLLVAAAVIAAAGLEDGTRLLAQAPSLRAPAISGSWVSDEPPSLSPPESVEGTFVSDGAVEQPSPPTMPGSQAVASDQAESMPEGCDPYEGGDYGAEEGGNAGGFEYGNLWADVHECRKGWARFEALSWKADGNSLPALVTTSPVGTPQDQAGVLPESVTTAILFGNEEVDTGERTGSRLSAGYWLEEGQFTGIEGHYLRLEQASTNFFANSTFSDGTLDDAILARPFFNADVALQDSFFVAFPDFSLGGVLVDVDGSIDIRTTSEIESAGIGGRKLLWIDFNQKYRVDVIGGYRFFSLRDSVTINDSLTTVGGVLAETRFDSTDEFAAKNRFHGGEIGMVGQIHRGRFSLELLGKVALGNNTENVRINGVNSITTLGTTITTPGGLLTQPTNIGEFERDRFCILPEGSANLRFDLTKNLRASLGFTVINLSRVIHSGRQIDLALNPTQVNGGTLVGEARPAFAFQEENFWMSGTNASLEWRF